MTKTETGWVITLKVEAPTRENAIVFFEKHLMQLRNEGFPGEGEYWVGGSEFDVTVCYERSVVGPKQKQFTGEERQELRDLLNRQKRLVAREMRV